MTVTKKEIEELQHQIEKRIDAIRLSVNPDSSKLFDLSMLDSNISLFLLASEFKDDPIELKASDKMIIDALKSFSSSSSEKEDITVVAREASAAASEILDLVEQFERTLDERKEKIFTENIRSRLNIIKIYLNQLATLKNQSRRTLKKWETEEVPLPLFDKKEEENKTKKTSVPSKKENTDKKDLKKISPIIKTKTEGNKTSTKKKEDSKKAKTTSKTNATKIKEKSKEKGSIPKKNEKPKVKVVPKKNNAKNEGETPATSQKKTMTKKSKK